MRISDWSSDVCSSDLDAPAERRAQHREGARPAFSAGQRADAEDDGNDEARSHRESADRLKDEGHGIEDVRNVHAPSVGPWPGVDKASGGGSRAKAAGRLEERRVGSEWVRTGRSRWVTYT